MNRAQMTAPFAEEELRQFEGRGGKVMTFIEDETVMDRLDAGYGYGNWQIQVEETRTDGVVKVRLGVRENGEWAWYEDFGYPNQKGGDELKEAVSDGIRRCGRYLGIARDLYRKSTYEPGGSLGPKTTRKPADRPAANPPAQSEGAAEARTTHRDGLIGKAIAQGTQDFQLRQGPDGPVLPFRIKEGRLSQIAVASGDIAQALDTFREAVIGQRCTVWGYYTDESYDKKDKDGNVQTITYKVLHVERIATPDWILPAPATDTPLRVVSSGPDEAPPIWEPLDEEERALIAGSLP